MNTNAAVVQADADPWKYFWYLVYFAVMGITAIPLFVDLQLPKVLNQVTLLFIHEFAGFLFVGHTLFSNIWAMRIRMTQPEEAGVWARGRAQHHVSDVDYFAWRRPVADGILRWTVQ